MDAWRKDACAFVDRHLEVLRARPVWLFSSGPLGDGAGGEVPPGRAEQLAIDVDAVDHHVFGGRLDRSTLGPGERLVAAVVHAPSGDFRPWDEIDEWADAIAESLSAAELTR
jgi:menaquinone-dependent protoporphyrinogen oxidase